MEQFETKLNTLGKMGREVKLTDSERLSVRSHLETQMRISRVAETRKTPSPYFSSFSFTQFAKIATFVFVCVIATGGSIGYISASALPGDALYSVKTDIVEKVKGSFATSPEARLAYQEELMYKRLEEINTLKEQNRLDESRSISAKRAIVRQTNSVSVALAEIEPGNTTLAKEKVRAISDELKRRENIFRNNQPSVSSTMSITGTTDAILSPVDSVANEIKATREYFETKEKTLEDANRQKAEDGDLSTSLEQQKPDAPETTPLVKETKRPTIQTLK